MYTDDSPEVQQAQKVTNSLLCDTVLHGTAVVAAVPVVSCNP